MFLIIFDNYFALFVDQRLLYLITIIHYYGGGAADIIILDRRSLFNGRNRKLLLEPSDALVLCVL